MDDSEELACSLPASSFSLYGSSDYSQTLAITIATLVSDRNVAHASRAGTHSYGYQPAVNDFSRPSYMPTSYRPGASQGGLAGGAAPGFEAATVASLSAASSSSASSSSSSSSGSDTGSDSDLTADAKPFRRGQRQHVNGYYTPKRSARPGAGGLSAEGKYSAPHHRQRQQLEQQQRRQQQQQRRGDGGVGQQQVSLGTREMKFGADGGERSRGTPSPILNYDLCATPAPTCRQQLTQEVQKGQMQLLPKTYVEPDGKTHYLTEQERIPRLTPAGQVVYITRYAENVPNLRVAQQM